MKLIRFGDAGREEPGIILEDGRWIDASSQFHDYDEGFFAFGGMDSLAEWVASGCPNGVEVNRGVRLGAPVARPSKIICVGKNYLDHAKEFGGEIPVEPVIFQKASSAWSGPNDDLICPKGATKLDYEVELAVVMGRTASRVKEDAITEYIAGYSVFCDYSERSWQRERGGQWTKGKSFDGFAPMGPWLTPADAVDDPQGLRLWTKVNGEIRQSGWTGDMLFSVRHCLSYISKFMTLLPGDVVATGTPAGVGMAMNPPAYLVPGDCVELGIDDLGAIKQRIVASAD